MKTSEQTAETNNIVPITKQNTMLEEMKHNITASWRNPESSIIETAMLLLEAENTLSRADSVALTKYLEENNILSGSVISKLRQIARNSALTDQANVLVLPPFYPELYKDNKRKLISIERNIANLKIEIVTQITVSGV